MYSMDKKLKFGMVGGGRGAFIGSVHRIAAIMDGQAELVAGAFSSDPETSRLSGEDLFLPPERVYSSFEDMANRERDMGPEQRLDLVIVVTPNHLHFEPTRLFLESGFHVVCDKPLATNLREALELREIVRSTGRIFALTHNYTGNVMVKMARKLIRENALGVIRKVIVEYPQGWLFAPLEKSGVKQAEWRTDPSRSGPSGCIGDLGSHAENLVGYVTGLRIASCCADLTSFVQGRALEDDGNILMRLENGAKGILHASQICAGDENNLNIRVYGDRAALEWHQEHPNELIVKFPDQPRKIFRRGNDYVDVPNRFTRVPFGHPEGYLEAFANVYLEVFRAIRDFESWKSSPTEFDFPTIEDGLQGMRFIDAVIESARDGSRWVSFADST